ncbi:hypothetical protein EMCRGX_G034575 [Ephydatia muelleri]
MAGEEDAELRDLVTQTLENKGVLGKIRAQLRASVFVALEEQESMKTPHAFVSRRLRDYLQTQEGQLAAGIVREFLEHFELDFTRSVFDPETNILTSYLGRERLASTIGLDAERNDAPLLTQILERATCQQQPPPPRPDTHTPITGGGSSRRASAQEASTVKINGDIGIAPSSSLKQAGTKKSKEDLLAGIGGSPYNNQDHGSSDHSADLDRFFEDSTKPHSKGAKYLDGNTEAAAHKGIAAGEEIRKSKSKADGAYEDDFQSDGEVMNLSESTEESECLTGGKLETTDVSVSHSTLGGDFDYAESIHSQ